MNRHILRSRMKSRKTNPRLRIDKKEATTFARGALSKRRSSTSLRRIKTSPRRSRVPRTTRFTGMSVLSSKAYRSRSCLQSPSNSGALNLTRRQLRVSWRIRSLTRLRWLRRWKRSGRLNLDRRTGTKKRFIRKMSWWQRRIPQPCLRRSGKSPTTAWKRTKFQSLSRLLKLSSSSEEAWARQIYLIGPIRPDNLKN